MANLVLQPIGARLIVEDIISEDDVTARAKAVGLVAVVHEYNQPRPTQGKIIALGSDPLVHELFSIGDIVLFRHHAGVLTRVQGKEYRTLELHEITAKLTETTS